MTKQYYECHITMRNDIPEYISPLYIKNMVEMQGWTFSKIDGDPDLGEGVKCYATHHFNIKLPKEEVIKTLNEVAVFLEKCEINVIRRKVELVIYDDRKKLNED